MYAKGVRPRYCNYLTLLLHKTRSAVTAGPKLLPKNRDFGNTLLEGAQALHPRNLYSQNVTETAELLRAKKCSFQAILDTNNKHLDVPGS